MSLNETSDFVDEFEACDPLKPLRTYLITYSQCDFAKCETTERFGDIVSREFISPTCKVAPQHWAVCMEEHADGGFHYHMSISLSGPKKWVKVRETIEKKHGIKVNFSMKSGGGYYAAYKYVCKNENVVHHSAKHPDLTDVGSPVTKKCMNAHASKRRNRRSSEAAAQQSTSTAGSSSSTPTPPAKKARLTNFDLFRFIVKKQIKDLDELLNIANEQQEQCKNDLAAFVLNKTEKQLADIIKMTWRMQNARKTVERKNSDRMQIIQGVQCNESCLCNNEGDWLRLAIETLSRNNINKYVFAHAIRDLLKKGRSKHRNIMIVGRSNCAKTFLFRPIEVIFDTFSNPANNKYGWIGVDNAEAILLNDIRWTQELITWDDFLRLLEGHVVNLPAPKNHFARDIRMDRDSPIFATWLEEIKFLGNHNSKDVREDEMMASRWKVFKFFYRIEEVDVEEAEPCPKCFVELVMLGNEEQ